MPEIIIVFLLGVTSTVYGIFSLNKAYWYKYRADVFEALILSCEIKIRYNIHGGKMNTYIVEVEFFDAGSAIRRKKIIYQGTGGKKLQAGKTVNVYYDKKFILRLVSPTVFKLPQNIHSLLFGVFTLLFGFGFLLITVLALIYG